jgi:molybdate transport system substrate-binding protein
MRCRLTVAAITILALAAFTAPAQAAEIKVFCSNGLRAVVQEIVPAFERESHHTVSLDFGPAAVLSQRIQAGQAFDLAILTPEAVDTLVASGRATAASRITVALSPLGLAMKAGAAKPDIATVAGLTRALRAAHSITWATQGASAKPFEAILERLGLTAVIARKFQPRQTGAEVGEAVASGAVEYGVIPLSEILPVAGAAVAGVFPPEAQSELVMVAVVASNARDARASADLVRFLSAPTNEPILKARGMRRP